jgi:hypothetical protein
MVHRYVALMIDKVALKNTSKMFTPIVGEL